VPARPSYTASKLSARALFLEKAFPFRRAGRVACGHRGDERIAFSQIGQNDRQRSARPFRAHLLLIEARMTVDVSD